MPAEAANPTDSRSHRNIGLDILRAIAVLLVIGRHLELPSQANPILSVWKRGGWVGVDLFFVLSGFLVSSLLFLEYIRYGSLDIKRFLIRRAFKIYPAFWLLIFVSLLVRFILQSPPPTLQIIGETLFLQNYLGGIWGHTWSLAVEEHFYIGIAVLFVFFLRSRSSNPFSHIPTTFVVTAIGCFALRLLTAYLLPSYSPKAYSYATHVRIDSLMFGVFLSYLWHFRELQETIKRIPTVALIALGVVLFSPAFIYRLETTRWLPVAGVILLYCGSGLFVIATIRFTESKNRLARFIAGLGAASYSVYLWHMPVAIWGRDLIANFAGGPAPFLINAAIAIGGAFFTGWLLNRLLEDPILKLRNRAFPSRSVQRPIAEETEGNDTGILSYQISPAHEE